MSEGKANERPFSLLRARTNEPTYNATVLVRRGSLVRYYLAKASNDGTVLYTSDSTIEMALHLIGTPNYDRAYRNHYERVIVCFDNGSAYYHAL